MIHVSMGANRALEQIIAERDRQMVINARLSGGLQDMVEFSAYPGTREHAAKILDLSVELKRAIPRT